MCFRMRRMAAAAVWMEHSNTDRIDGKTHQSVRFGLRRSWSAFRLNRVQSL